MADTKIDRKNTLTFYTQKDGGQQSWCQVIVSDLEQIDSNSSEASSATSKAEKNADAITQLRGDFSSSGEDIYSYNISDLSDTGSTLVDETMIQVIQSVSADSRSVRVADINGLTIGSEYYITNYIHSEPIVIVEIKAIPDVNLYNEICKHCYELLLKNVVKNSYSMQDASNIYIVKSNLGKQDVSYTKQASSIATNNVTILSNKISNTASNDSTFNTVTIQTGELEGTVTELVLHSSNSANIANVTANVADIITGVADVTANVASNKVTISSSSFVQGKVTIPSSSFVQSNVKDSTITIPLSAFTKTGSGSGTKYSIDIDKNFGDVTMCTYKSFSQGLNYNIKTSIATRQYSSPYLRFPSQSYGKTVQTDWQDHKKTITTFTTFGQSTEDYIIQKYEGNSQFRILTDVLYEIDGRDDIPSSITFYDTSKSIATKSTITSESSYYNNVANPETDIITSYSKGKAELSINKDSATNMSMIRVMRYYYDQNHVEQHSNWETLQESCEQSAHKILFAVCFSLDHILVNGTIPETEDTDEKQEIYRRNNGTILSAAFSVYYASTTNLAGSADNASLYTKAYYPVVSFKQVSINLTLYDNSVEYFPSVYLSKCDSTKTRLLYPVYPLASGYGLDISSQSFTQKASNINMNSVYFFLSQNGDNIRELALPKTWSSDNYIFARRGANEVFKYPTVYSSGKSFTEGYYSGSTFVPPVAPGYIELKSNDSSVIVLNDQYIKIAAEKSVFSTCSLIEYVYTVCQYMQNELNLYTKSLVKSDDDYETYKTLAENAQTHLDQIIAILLTEEYQYNVTAKTLSTANGFLELAMKFRDAESESTQAIRTLINANYSVLLVDKSTPSKTPFKNLYDNILNLAKQVINFINTYNLSNNTVSISGLTTANLQMDTINNSLSNYITAVIKLFEATSYLCDVAYNTSRIVVSTRWDDIDDLYTKDSDGKFTSTLNQTSLGKQIALHYGYYSYEINPKTKVLTHKDITDSSNQYYKINDTYYAVLGADKLCKTVTDQANKALILLSTACKQDLSLDLSSMSIYVLVPKKPNTTSKHQYVLGTVTTNETDYTVTAKDFSGQNEETKYVIRDEKIDFSTLQVYVNSKLLLQYPNNDISNPTWYIDPATSILTISDVSSVTNHTEILSTDNVSCSYKYSMPDDNWILMNQQSPVLVDSSFQTVKYVLNMSSDDISGFKIKIVSTMHNKQGKLMVNYPEQYTSKDSPADYRVTTHSLSLDALKNAGLTVYLTTDSLFAMIHNGYNYSVLSKDLSTNVKVIDNIYSKQYKDPYTNMYRTLRRYEGKSSKASVDHFFVDVSDIVDEYDRIRSKVMDLIEESNGTYKWKDTYLDNKGRLKDSVIRIPTLNSDGSIEYSGGPFTILTWTSYGGCSLVSSGLYERTSKEEISTEKSGGFYYDAENREMSVRPFTPKYLGQDSNLELHISYAIHKDDILTFIANIKDSAKYGFFTKRFGTTKRKTGTTELIEATEITKEGDYDYPQVIKDNLQIVAPRGNSVVNWALYLPPYYSLHYNGGDSSTTLSTIRRYVKDDKSVSLDMPVICSSSNASVKTGDDYNYPLQRNNILFSFQWDETPIVTAVKASWN